MALSVTQTQMCQTIVLSVNNEMGEVEGKSHGSFNYCPRSNIYINNQHMHSNIYDAFYSQCSQQHVSAGILAIFSVMLLLQEHKHTDVVNCVTITP